MLVTLEDKGERETIISPTDEMKSYKPLEVHEQTP